MNNQYKPIFIITMKKLKTIASVLAVGILALTTLTSCDRTVNTVPVQQKDNDTYSAVYELKGVNFTKNTTTGNYEIYKKFTSTLYDADQVLIYRKSGTNTLGNTIWQSIPITLYYSNNREFDYGFDFSKNDFLIKAGGNFDVSTMPENLNNQTFRVVIVPGYFGRAAVDKTDYNAIIKYYNIDESKIKTLY